MLTDTLGLTTPYKVTDERTGQARLVWSSSRGLRRLLRARIIGTKSDHHLVSDTHIPATTGVLRAYHYDRSRLIGTYLVTNTTWGDFATYDVERPKDDPSLDQKISNAEWDRDHGTGD